MHSYAQKGKLPGVKMGNKWRFSKKKLEDIIYTGQGIKRQGKVTYTERDRDEG